MKNGKYNKFLTTILIVVGVTIIGIGIYMAYDYIHNYFVEKDAESFIENFDTEIPVNGEIVEGEADPEENGEVGTNKKPSGGGSSGSSSATNTYKGFEVLGKIEIPKNQRTYPILNSSSPKALAVAVSFQYGPGPNKVGNTVIVGHNYRNSQFFSKNKKLNLGDIIYITDMEGNRVKYTIYNKYETTPEDAAYMTRNTNNQREVSLSTCTDDNARRLIIWAKAE